METGGESSHRRAAEAFVREARDRFDAAIEAIHLFGSVAQGDERGVRSDVDLLVVVSDDTDESSVASAIRDLAYEVELDHGVVLSLVIRTRSQLNRNRNRSFVRTVNRTGKQLYG